MQNPFLPLDVYIPDGEPHVFGNRVYLFGSHDKENGDTYCMLDYEFWSAPVDDLSDWRCPGVSYSAKQDPDYGDELKYMYAPDVVRGNDGRFYLYYCMAGHKGQGGYGQKISVAVCDTPDGKYEYYGFVRNPDGSPMKKYVTFDPAAINDNGTIRLYYGTWYPFHEYGRILDPIFYLVESSMFSKSAREIRSYKDGIMGANHVELADDMLTIKSEPRHIMPTKVRGTSFEKHPFFEGSSIRKINGIYYFIYSSLHGHELCYATSEYPDRDFIFRGVIVSGGDVGYHGRRERDRLNATGTNHGSIECIDGQWYVFYHRNTNKTAYSRQACAEQIEILPDGSIPQVEITTQGLNEKPLIAKGKFPAVLCCNLTNGKMPHLGNGVIKKRIPYITSEEEKRFVVVTPGTFATYKYFEFTGEPLKITLSLDTECDGVISVISSENEIDLTVADIKISRDQKVASAICHLPKGRRDLSFLWHGNEDIRLYEFDIEGVLD